MDDHEPKLTPSDYEGSPSELRETARRLFESGDEEAAGKLEAAARRIEALEERVEEGRESPVPLLPLSQAIDQIDQMKARLAETGVESDDIEKSIDAVKGSIEELRISVGFSPVFRIEDLAAALESMIERARKRLSEKEADGRLKRAFLEECDLRLVEAGNAVAAFIEDLREEKGRAPRRTLPVHE